MLPYKNILSNNTFFCTWRLRKRTSRFLKKWIYFTDEYFLANFPQRVLASYFTGMKIQNIYMIFNIISKYKSKEDKNAQCALRGRRLYRIDTYSEFFGPFSPRYTICCFFFFIFFVILHTYNLTSSYQVKSQCTGSQISFFFLRFAISVSRFDIFRDWLFYFDLSFLISG